MKVLGSVTVGRPRDHVRGVLLTEEEMLRLERMWPEPTETLEEMDRKRTRTLLLYDLLVGREYARKIEERNDIR